MKLTIDMLYTGQEGVARLLIENGADINIANIYNNTPMLSAIREGIYKNV